MFLKNKYPMGVLDKYRMGVYYAKQEVLTMQDEMKSKKIKDTEAASEGAVCPQCARIKVRSSGEYKKLINRLNRIEGQIRGIRGMVEKNAYCPDILVQSAAVTAAVHAFNRELLANHIRSCVSEDIRAGKDETVDELVKLLEKFMK